MKSRTSRFWTQILVGAMIQGAVQALVELAILRGEKKTRRKATTNE